MYAHTYQDVQLKCVFTFHPDCYLYIYAYHNRRFVNAYRSLLHLGFHWLFEHFCLLGPKLNIL